MYGTTMIGTKASGVTIEQIQAEVATWEQQRNVPGFMSSHVMLADDGETVINVAIFDSKESYVALADDPVQDEWWQKHYMPLLAGEPKWVDGTWLS